MKQILLNLQMFGEGGTGAGGTGTGSGSEGSANVGSGATQGEDLSSVIYGVSTESVADSTGEKTTNSHEDKAKTFDNMIKKGGEYAEEFNKRTQSIIDKRFKASKEMEATLNSHNPIMDALAKRYDVDASDTEALLRAINEDDDWLEKKAFEEGLTKKQYKEKLALEAENAQLRQAEEEAKRRAHSEEIYKGWLDEADSMVQRYGLTNFDLSTEIQNPEFAQLLSNGLSLESAYKAIHFDEMLGGAMAQTAANIEQKVTNRIASRQARPSEAGLSSQSTKTFKNDVNKLSYNDIDEVFKRIRGGETISFG